MFVYVYQNSVIGTFHHRNIATITSPLQENITQNNININLVMIFLRVFKEENIFRIMKDSYYLVEIRHCILKSKTTRHESVIALS